jgi:hypothetical protein
MRPGRGDRLDFLSCCQLVAPRLRRRRRRRHRGKRGRCRRADTPRSLISALASPAGITFASPHIHRTSAVILRRLRTFPRHPLILNPRPSHQGNPPRSAIEHPDRGRFTQIPANKSENSREGLERGFSHLRRSRQLSAAKVRFLDSSLPAASRRVGAKKVAGGGRGEGEIPRRSGVVFGVPAPRVCWMVKALTIGFLAVANPRRAARWRGMVFVQVSVSNSGRGWKGLLT